MNFVDWLTNWPGAFAMPDKRTQYIEADLILTKIFLRYGTFEQIVTDNGPENVTTSPYHPQSNAKVEHFHKTLADMLAKLTGDNQEDCDLFLMQTLAAVRFTINETSQYSPYFLLFGRDIVLPIDNLLKSHRKYLGKDHHKLILER